MGVVADNDDDDDRGECQWEQIILYLHGHGVAVATDDVEQLIGKVCVIAEQGSELPRRDFLQAHNVQRYN